MTESWTIYIRVRGENTDSLRNIYDKFDKDGIDSVNRTGKAKVISTNCFNGSEDDEIRINITVECSEEYDDMPDYDQIEMIYEVFTYEYINPWTSWFQDNFDKEDYRIIIHYDGSYDTYGDGCYDGSEKQSKKNLNKNVNITKKDIIRIHFCELRPDINSNFWFDVDDASINIDDVICNNNDVTINISGTCTKCIKGINASNCTFEYTTTIDKNDFNKQCKYSLEHNWNHLEICNGKITVNCKETNITESDISDTLYNTAYNIANKLHIDCKQVVKNIISRSVYSINANKIINEIEKIDDDIDVDNGYDDYHLCLYWYLSDNIIYDNGELQDEKYKSVESLFLNELRALIKNNTFTKDEPTITWKMNECSSMYIYLKEDIFKNLK